MSIQRAYQLSLSASRFSGGYFQSARGSDQILGQHMLTILAREQSQARFAQRSLADLNAFIERNKVTA
jgi:hypothetical protein